MKPILDVSILVLTVAMMAVVGMGLEVSHFADLTRRRRIVPTALIGQMVLLPIIGWVVTRLMTLPPHLSAGLLLIAACPVGDIANFYTALGRANRALSVVVNTLSCLLAAATMMVVFKIYSLLDGAAFLFAAPPAQLAGRLVLMTALPVAAGMLLRRSAPRLAERSAPVIQGACILGLAAVIVMIVVVQADLVVAEWKPAAGASLLLMAVALAVGWGLSAALGHPVVDRLTFAVLFSVRNVGLAMAVAVTVLGRTEYAAFAVVYFLTEVPLLLGVVAVYRFRLARGTWVACGEATA